MIFYKFSNFISINVKKKVIFAYLCRNKIYTN